MCVCLSLLQISNGSLYKFVTETRTTAFCYLEGLDKSLNSGDTTPTFVLTNSILKEGGKERGKEGGRERGREKGKEGGMESGRK